MRKRSLKFAVLAIVSLVMAGSSLWGQTTVFTDNFNRSLGVIPLTNGGTPTMTWTTATTAPTSTVSTTAAATVDPTNYVVQIYNSTTAPAVGRTYITGPLSTYTAPFVSTLSNNVGPVTWTFNMKTNRASVLSGFDAGNYGAAVILAMTGTNPANTAALGYAAVLVKGVSGNAVKLVRFANGLILNANVTTIIGPSPDLAALGNYASVKVVYTPSSNTWQLFVRDDASTTDPQNPATGTLTQVGSNTVNSTYTSVAMTSCGLYWGHSNGAAASNKGIFDNFTVTVNPTLVPALSIFPAALTGFNYMLGSGPSASQSFTVNGLNLQGFPGNVTVTGSANYEVSLDDITYAASVNIPFTSATLNTTTVYTRLKAGLAAGIYNAEIITVAGGSAVAQTISCSGFVLGPPTAYTWTGFTSNDWQVATNWNPNRTAPALNDILQFNDGGTYTVTNVPAQTIAQLLITGNSKISLQAAAVGTLNIAGTTGTDLSVIGELNISGSNALSISLAAGATGRIRGSMTISGAAHRIIALDSNAVNFQTGSSFKVTTGFSGNSFGTANLNSVIFQDGSIYIQEAGANPFGATQPASVVRFEYGSTYRFLMTAGAPSFSGRTYGNFESDAPLNPLLPTGGFPVNFDNISLLSGSIAWDYAGPINIEGNIFVAPGASMTFGSGTNLTNVNLVGTKAQMISGAGSLIFGLHSNLNINNSWGCNLLRSVQVERLTLTNGIFNLTADTLKVNGILSGGSAGSYVNGKLQRFVTGTGSFDFPVGKGGNYRPINVNFSTLDASTLVTAEQIESSLTGPFPTGTVIFPGRYWSISQLGATNFTYDITLNGTGFAPLTSPMVVKKENGLVTNYAATFTSPNYTALGLSSFGDLTLGYMFFPPNITVNSNLTQFTTFVGQPSNAQSCTIQGTNLSGDLLISAPAEFEISLLPSANFGSSLTIPQVGGVVTPTLVYIRFNPAVAYPLLTDNITISSFAAQTLSIPVAGTSILVNTIVSPTILSGFVYVYGSGPSSEQSFNVAGTNLMGNVNITAPTNYEITTTSGSGYTSYISLTPVGGTLSSTVIYLRLKSGLVVANYNETINITSIYSTDKTVSCYGSVSPLVTPSLNVGFLAFFGNVCINNTVGPNNFVVTGSNLTTDPVIIGALPGFTYCGTYNGTYTPTLTLHHTSTLYKTVFVKFTPTLVQSYAGNIIITGGGAPSVNVVAAGGGIDIPPTVATLSPAGSVTQNSAICSGNVSAQGCSAITVRGICYGLTINPDITGTFTTIAGTMGSFVCPISGLLPATTYHYRAFATSASGTSYGADHVFTTITILPTALTEAATLITDAAAVLNGMVNANNSPTTITFEYGTTPAYGNNVNAVPSTITGMTGTPASFELTGLEPNTIYHYRIKAENAAGSVYGDDSIFLTLAIAPIAVTNAVTSHCGTSAVLHGTVVAHNMDAVVSFEYGPTTDYGTMISAEPDTVVGNNAVHVSYSLSDLSMNATYHYRVVAMNDAGVTFGDDVEFSTLELPVADAGLPDSIGYLGSALLNGSATGGMPPYQYLWSPEESLSNPSVSDPIATPFSTTTYTLKVTDANGCYGYDDVLIKVGLPDDTISGTVVYSNINSTPMNDVTVMLKDENGIILATMVTGADGKYTFADIAPGNYSIYVATTKPWGGANSTDALIILKQFAHMIELEGLPLIASDVSGDNFANSIDALLVARRFIQYITSFVVGDWILPVTNVTATGGGFNHVNTIYTLCYGDVNQSYIPPSN